MPGALCLALWAARPGALAVPEPCVPCSEEGQPQRVLLLTLEGSPEPWPPGIHDPAVFKNLKINLKINNKF